MYLSSSASLAALELLAHVDPEDAPGDLVLIEVGLPAHAAIESMNEAARAKVMGWRERRTPPPEGQAFGDRWVKLGATLALMVPSVIIPSEENMLLNPAHSHMADVRVVSVKPFQFDPRLLLG